jgi:aldehyde:ferredoxin oxidoreductase
MGKVLFIDLATQKTQVEEVTDELYLKYLGGYGLGARILLENQPGGVDAFGPENLLGFMTGPLIGTRAQNASRFNIVSKSPLTKAWGDASCGGHMGPAIKGTGFDGIFFRGLSDHPVYCFLSNNEVRLFDASDLWGLDAFETESRLHARHGKNCQVSTIGPAGENRNLIAGIVHEEGRMAARCGLGAVMGAKRLKAVVATGSQPTPVADEEREKEVWKRYNHMVVGNLMVDSFRGFGTTGGLAHQISIGDTPIKNWKGSASTDFPWADEISGERIADLEARKYACHRCVLVCGAWLPNPDSRDEPKQLTRKPEYETVAAFGPLLLIHDLPTIIRANELCDRGGLDTISAGATIALAMECYETGLLTATETDGLDLSWGNASALIPLLQKMINREGFGAMLADGPQRAAEQIGGKAPEMAMAIRGEGVPMHDPRYRPGWATSYQTDATPAHHEQGGAHFGEGAWSLQGYNTPKFDKYHYNGKAHFQRDMSALVHVVNAVGLCKFLAHSLPISFVWEMLNAVTGTAWGLNDLVLAGERIAVVRQVFNLREGISPEDMRLPARIRGNPPLDNGPLQGISIGDDVQISEYLDLMRWDQKTGSPEKAHVHSLGLDDLLNFY